MDGNLPAQQVQSVDQQYTPTVIPITYPVLFYSRVLFNPSDCTDTWNNHLQRFSANVTANEASDVDVEVLVAKCMVLSREAFASCHGL
ncbi:hypothetical protein SUGI_0783560 [Cryptomeria japonica]|nr:hypothetical protein SUGI_0783560 [Cryptomeria japonica]